MIKTISWISLVWAGLFLPTLVIAGQPLETESARLPLARQMVVEGTFEIQTSLEGRELALPMAFEYGLSPRLSLMAEPVFYTAIRPKHDHRATGPGDLEATLECLVLEEKKVSPAVALAAEVKFPVARDKLIGTGKTDYTGYVILSKSLGRFDTHANLGYSIIGKPAGVLLKNIFVFGLAEELHTNMRIDIVGEIIGNTSSLETAENPFAGGENANSPELAGGELVGMIGGRYLLSKGIALSFGVSYDNSNAILLRPGVTFSF
jgi:hypothetical protein